jgi:hypothetical protein
MIFNLLILLRCITILLFILFDEGHDLIIFVLFLLGLSLWFERL